MFKLLTFVEMNSLFIFFSFISFQELTVILIFSVIIFGPKKIPEIARGLGEGIRAMKQATDDIKKEIMDPVDDINPMKEIQDTIDETKNSLTESVNDLPTEIDQTIDDAIGPVKRK